MSDVSMSGVARLEGWRRAVVFVVLFGAAVYLGRLTRMDGSQIAVVWPASGVAVLWLSTSWRRGRVMAVDLFLLEVATAATYVATGAPLALALGLGVVNVLQPVAACLVYERIAGPGPWRLTTTRHLTAIVIAALGAAIVGAAIGPAVNWIVADFWSVGAVAQWVLRNTVCIFLPVAAGVRLLSPHAPAAVAARRGVELLALAVTSVASYTAMFGGATGLPLSFVVLPLSLWAGLRFGTQVAAAHTVLVGTLAVGLTMQGLGPFAAEPLPVRAALAQAFIGVAGFIALVLALHREEREAILGELRAATRHAQEQASLLSSVLDSISDAVSAVDSEGHFVLRNPASRRLMGVTPDETPGDDAPTAWQDKYGLFHPDGTPIAHDDMPMVRALRGEPVTAMDMLIRNPAHPLGVLVNISTRTLEGPSGRHGAVAVYHDVTDDRRRQNELAAFAGVAAHDLVNPLATIDSWAGIVRDTIADFPDNAAAQAIDGIERIQRASARMRNLINDLLAYSTAKDAHLQPAPLELNDLVREVVGARLEALPGTATQPSITINDLPPVHVDPTQIRQLLDNLIGNALKYTPGDRAADITVSASPSVDAGWVNVQIADRGIGVPAGQHEVIFGDFHRAHAGGAFTGTGLGLAICRRIITRHGGSIVCRDNPGGGTTFTFTLPAASKTAAEASEAAQKRQPIFAGVA